MPDSPWSSTVTVPTGGVVTLMDGATPTGTVNTPAGTYTLTGATVTFVAVFGFSGNPTAATYRVTDSYAQSATCSYQPTVLAPTGPIAAPKTTKYREVEMTGETMLCKSVRKVLDISNM